jgi:predicted nucleic acid-binding protein
MARQEEEIPPRCLILDSGAIIGWARGKARPRAILRRALELGVDVRIPVPVLAETLRGGPRDAPIHRVRNAVDILPTTESAARLAGSLLGRTGGNKTVDALVAAAAVESDGDVLTSDRQDLKKLLGAFTRIAVLET